MTPLLTVVMPTHNRSQYATAAITSILAIKSQYLQLVVHDTSDSDDLECFVRGLQNDDRLKYIHYRSRLSMTENHNAAMRMAEGEYVCLIGDDDTIMPEALDAVAWAKSQGIDVLSPQIVANYAWPDFRSRFFGMGHSSRLYVRRKFGAIRLCGSIESLKRALQGAAQGTEGLPKVYHGFVRREIMETVRHRSGAYFHGSSPDVSGAIGVAMVTPFFIEIDYPLTLPGASGKSNTGRSATNTHKGALSKDAQTSEFAVNGWPPEVPRFFSVETVWAHAAIDTIRRVDEKCLKNFDFLTLYAICWLRHKEYRQETLCVFREGAWRSWQEIDSPLRGMLRRTVKILAGTTARLLRRALQPTAAGGRFYLAGVQTVAEAQASLVDHLTKRGTTVAGSIQKYTDR